MFIHCALEIFYYINVCIEGGRKGWEKKNKTNKSSLFKAFSLYICCKEEPHSVAHYMPGAFAIWKCSSAFQTTGNPLVCPSFVQTPALRAGAVNAQPAHILGVKPAKSHTQHPESRGLAARGLRAVSRGAALAVQCGGVVARPARASQGVWWETKGKDAVPALLLSRVSHGQCHALAFRQKRAHAVKALC